ncbi:hypothetical protein FPOAC1_007862 [Fusarium poae]|nr:hypothetical protein FPOAC1_007862 [Fusarium poae]KAG8668481.1 hypothetical protein FPOAC1_007862 [Fusarium poae]
MSSNKVMEETRAKSQESFLEFLLRGATLENPSSQHKEIVPVSFPRSPAKSHVAMAYQYQTESNRSITATITLVPTGSSASSIGPKANQGLKWDGCEADQGFDQNNGHEWDIGKNISNQVKEKNLVQCEYRDLINIGSGNQHNGHCLEIGDDVGGIVLPNMDGDRWTRCKVKNAAVEKKGVSLGTQTNGLKIKIKK